MPYIRAHSRSPSVTPPAATANTNMTSNDLKNSNSAGLALAGVPRRRMHLALGAFGQPAPAPALVPSADAAAAPVPTMSTSTQGALPTPDSSAHSTPSPSPPELSRTSSPARRPTFNVGSPKDDHRRSSSHGPSVSSVSSSSFGAARRFSSSSGSSSDSDDDNDNGLLRFRRIGHSAPRAWTHTTTQSHHWRHDEDETPRGRTARDSGFFDSAEGDKAASKEQEQAEKGQEPTRKPKMTLDLSAIRAPESERVPFPKDDIQSPSPTGVPFPAASGPPSPSVLPRTPSTPVIFLSNGKPLKSSLKSSASSPNLPPLHMRSRSCPTTPGGIVPTPGTPKSVHFPTRNEDLQHVRMFRPAGRPQAVSLDGNADETETETEGYDGGYPFPVIPPTASLAQDSIITLNTTLTSPVPTPSSTHHGATHANVHLETLQLPKSRPYTLVGSVLVRNVAYNKSIAIRFTMDDWQTTSEVTAHYVSSLPCLPPPFHESRSSPLGGGAAASQSGWDRFSWQVKLEDVTERRLVEKTMYLVVRFTAHGDGGGEWWDNNAGANYRVVFKKEPVVATRTTASSMLASTSAATRQLANQIRAENRSGGLPPLQLKSRRPNLAPSFSFGSAPRSVGGGARAPPAMDFGEERVTPSASAPSLSEKDKNSPTSPASPVRGLTLKNYCPPSSSPKSPPAIITMGLPVTQQPSPPRSPVRTAGPTLELTTREIIFEGGQPITVPVPLGASGSSFSYGRAGSPVHTPSLSASSSMTSTSSLTTIGGGRANVLPPSISLPARTHVDFSGRALGGSDESSPAGIPGANTVPFPGSPIGSPGTNANYEALVKQWCFGGSGATTAPAMGPAGGFGDQSQHAASMFGPGGADDTASSSFGYGPGERAGAGFLSFTGMGHRKTASEPEWFRGASGSSQLVVGEMA